MMVPSNAVGAGEGKRYWKHQKGYEQAKRFQMALARQVEWTIMLSAAKHLEAQRERPFAAAQGDRGEGHRVTVGEVNGVTR